VSKESHNSMAKIQIIHMIFKNKLIIYILPPILSPHTQLEYPSFGELEKYQCGKCTAVVDMSGFCIIFVSLIIFSLHNNRTTVDMPCPVMDGAYCFLYCSLMEIPTTIITFVCIIHIRFYKGAIVILFHHGRMEFIHKNLFLLSGQ